MGWETKNKEYVFINHEQRLKPTIVGRDIGRQ